MAEVTTPAEQPLRELTAQEFIELLEGKNSGKYIEYYQKWGTFELALIISESYVTENLNFDENFKPIDLPIIITGRSQFNEFWVNGGVFSNMFRIEGGKFMNNFRLGNCTFLKEFYIGGGEFIKNFYIDSAIFHSLFYINGGVFYKHTYIFGGEFKSHFAIRGGRFVEKIHITSGFFPEIVSIEGGIYNGLFIIEGGRFNKLFFRSFEQIFIEKLLLQVQSGLIPFIQIIDVAEKCTINAFTLKDVIHFEEEIIQVNGVNFNQIEFTNVLNYGNITLTDVNTTPAQWVNAHGIRGELADSPVQKLSIHNSDLGKTTWIGCNFSAAELHLASAKLTDMFVTGTQLPITISNNNPEQRRLGYGQLRKVYENRGDSTVANEYFARQMNAFMETLDWHWRGDFWEKLNLWLNRFSTNHGQSWQRGLGVTLGVSAAFFGVYLLSLRIWPGTNVAYFFKVWSYWLEFINPIHDAGFVAEELSGVKETSLSRFVEGTSRIFIAYFIYQLIQAFRKHGKKGE